VIDNQPPNQQNPFFAMKPVMLLAVPLENRVGELSRLAQVLAEAGVNILWVTIVSSQLFGVVHLLVDKHELAMQVLNLHGIQVRQHELLAVEVEDRPGGLHGVVESLAKHEINIQNASGFVANHRAVLLIEADDLPRAREVLTRERLSLLSQEEIFTI
jgi:hypothetical protein